MIVEKLLKWKTSEKRKPLILKGVRQCGKTYTLRKFGDDNYSNTAYFNFEDDPNLKHIFEKDLKPLRILDDLRLRYQIKITENTLIIFDEIQFCGKALTSLKYFCEDAPEYHVVCAGSLLGVMLSKPTSFPVGKVNIMTLYPMSFPEFIVAAGRADLYGHLKELPRCEPLSDVFLPLLMALYREYCFVGGMPEAVLSWISERDPDAVREIQNDILKLYELDFAKHAPPSMIQKLNRIWSSVPAQLSKDNKKFLFGHAVEGGRARELEDALQWLIDAGIVIKTAIISRPFMPLSAYADPSSFKLYFSDVGLLGAMAKVSASSIISGDEKYTEFKGGMTENYVLTELVAATGDTPFCWRSGNKAEVDFVHILNGMIVPIEVKAGRPKRMQSMELYLERYEPDRAFAVSEHDVKEGKLTFVPLPLVWNIERYI